MFGSQTKVHVMGCLELYRNGRLLSVENFNQKYTLSHDGTFDGEKSAFDDAFEKMFNTIKSKWDNPETIVYKIICISVINRQANNL